MNTQQKQRFFASYIDVICVVHHRVSEIKTTPLEIFKSGDIERYKLQLTHPSKITDAHCVELFDLIDNVLKDEFNEEFTTENKIELIKHTLENNELMSLSIAELIISFLRNHAYIFQFEGVSIEEMVESGVVELK